MTITKELVSIGTIITGSENNINPAQQPNTCLATVIEFNDTTVTFRFIASSNKELDKAWKNNPEEATFNIFWSVFIELYDIASQELINKLITPTKGKQSNKIEFKEEGLAIIVADTIVSNFNKDRILTPETDEGRRILLRELYDIKKKNPKKTFKDIVKENPKFKPIQDELFNKEVLKKTLDNLINFFKEFEVYPSLRQVNCLARLCQKSISEGIKYIKNYYTLSDSPYKEAISSKTGSEEFKGILKILSSFDTEKVINKRLKIYYGPQGTGKSTMAMRELHIPDATNDYTDDDPNRGFTIVCSSSMTPDDIMQDFGFVDGKAQLNESVVIYAMKNGRGILLDEFRNLSNATLDFIQSWTDDKSEFVYKGQVIKIHPNFRVIGTMNLVKNGVIYSIPEPLVDRCSEIREFKNDATLLMGAII